VPSGTDGRIVRLASYFRTAQMRPALRQPALCARQHGALLRLRLVAGVRPQAADSGGKSRVAAPGTKSPPAQVAASLQLIESMKPSADRVRVLYSFPHKLGAGRICYTAWQQVNGLAAVGADVTVFPGVLHRPV